LLKLDDSQDDIRIRDGQKPYLGVLDGKKLVACLWLDKEEDECEFSIITHPEHRNKGYAHRLLKELLADKFSGKISGELVCEPVNPSILKMIKEYKFSPDYGNSDFWSFDL
jgi:GNAT superfamily N-acetyltransferase